MWPSQSLPRRDPQEKKGARHGAGRESGPAARAPRRRPGLGKCERGAEGGVPGQTVPSEQAARAGWGPARAAARARAPSRQLKERNNRETEPPSPRLPARRQVRRRPTSRRAPEGLKIAPGARRPPPGVCFLPPAPQSRDSPPHPTGLRAPARCPRVPPGSEAGCAEVHAVAGRGNLDAGSRGGGGGFWPLGTRPPARRPRSLSSLSRRLGPQGCPMAAGPDGRGRALLPSLPLAYRLGPPLPPAGSCPPSPIAGRAFPPRGTEIDTNISPTPVITRGQELWPRSPPVSSTAHTRRCSTQQEIQNVNACPHPLRGSGGHLCAPSASRRRGPVTTTVSPAENAHPGERRKGLRAGTLEVTEPVPPPPASQPLRAARLPARPPGWLGRGREEEVRKEVGVGRGGEEGRERQRSLLPVFNK